MRAGAWAKGEASGAGTGFSSHMSLVLWDKGLMGKAFDPETGLVSGPVTAAYPALLCPGRLIQPRGQAGGHRPRASTAADATDGWPAGCLPSRTTATWGLWRLHHGGRCLAQAALVGRWLGQVRGLEVKVAAGCKTLQHALVPSQRSCSTRQPCWQLHRAQA